jgi:hypothetical protein
MGKIAGALIALQAEVRAIELTGHNDYSDYNYMKEEELIFALRPLLEANKLAFLKSLASVEDTAYKPAKGYGTRVVLCGMLIHESGEWIKFYSAGDGQDVADKGVYKALTGASKYLMAKAFGFPTGDDPEGDTETDKEAKKKNPTHQDTPSGSGQQSQNTGRDIPPKDSDFLTQMAGFKESLSNFSEILGKCGWERPEDVPTGKHGFVLWNMKQGE